jgi:cytochrome c oxidase cbb3-type subunit 3
MSSPCPRTERRAALACALLLALVATGCERERREYAHKGPPTTPSAEAVRVGQLQPGKAQDEHPDPKGRHFEGNAYHVNQGQQLYKWFNCNGCHAAGGGAIGPALMDAEWRYGGSMEQIHASIAQGRPNGMPSFRGKIPDDQIWQIAAYVRTLSGNAPKYVAGGASEGMAATPAPSRLPKLEPKTSENGQ